MPSNRRMPPWTSATRQLLIPCPPRPYLFPLQSILLPTSIPTPNSVRARLKGDTVHDHAKRAAFKDWTGTTTQDHAVNRASNRDITDPEIESTVAGLQERDENEGIADQSKSHATTERDSGRHSKRAKEESPAAPEPVIGMTDEKGHSSVVQLANSCPTERSLR
ncbi:hypothetical protein T310_5495 [Rasamsonia emersonii CBS 393.64]|uniref:Uncharacterized protein n=1 Tax=Rasamsonia emersonii (strain ATCC 16479 / CBS 393.64 / IMI 116815) TaxID=1408163 RepID=A0A0F4YRJ4_RASE3|nr:hypothetical protein T310_5495 [Rasamsonia emersonii CBS 393.64]KKA20476.1 hypothetical protein T310_5495 [Rasamsonia emersonii CBS 393.64]